MTEREYADRIVGLWPVEGEAPSRELLEIAAEAVLQHPDSTELLCLRADLYRLEHEPWSNRLDPNIPLGLYQRALSLDPHCTDALTEVGFIYDVYFDDFQSAEAAFRKAISLGADYAAYYGLARVLSEAGRSDEAVAVLEPQRCPHADHPEIRELLDEIKEGIWEAGA